MHRLHLFIFFLAGAAVHGHEIQRRPPRNEIPDIVPMKTDLLNNPTTTVQPTKSHWCPCLPCFWHCDLLVPVPVVPTKTSTVFPVVPKPTGCGPSDDPMLDTPANKPWYCS